MIDIQYIGRAPIYRQVPRYVEVPLPFTPYRITTSVGCWETNVSNIFLSIYGEALAVPMTAWGDMREHHPHALEKVCARFGRDETRRQFIESVSFERIF